VIFNEYMKAAGEDLEYWNKAFLSKFYYLDKPLTKYQIHKNKNSLKKLIDEYLQQRINSKGDYPKYINNLVQNQIIL
jgi:hypothetical protein